MPRQATPEEERRFHEMMRAQGVPVRVVNAMLVQHSAHKSIRERAERIVNNWTRTA